MAIKILCWVTLLASFLAGARAQDIAGNWQATIKAGQQDLRLTFRIERDGPEWTCRMSSIDRPDPGARTPASIAVEGTSVKIVIPPLRAYFEGKLSPDGTSILGTWTQTSPFNVEFTRATPETAWKETAPHSIQFVDVGNGVKLEVLDWGGTGRPVVLVPGLGNTAHFDRFALKLIAQNHVYGITRRGFGASTAPATGYAADRLGDDVLAVMDALKIEKPVLVGHSLGGEELSSVGTRHAERVAGLVYLDAGYSYAFYDPSRGDLELDLIELETKLARLHQLEGPFDQRPLIKDLLESALPGLERDLREQQKTIEMMGSPATADQPQVATPDPVRAVIRGMQKYGKISVPVLAIYAIPHDYATSDPAVKAKQATRDEEIYGSQAKAFEEAQPMAKVVRLPHANHYVFQSNEADVLREMNAFLSGLK